MTEQKKHVKETEVNEETLKQFEKTMDEFIRLAKQGANLITLDYYP